jgi:hypothetical protein
MWGFWREIHIFSFHHYFGNQNLLIFQLRYIVRMDKRIASVEHCVKN